MTFSEPTTNLLGCLGIWVRIIRSIHPSGFDGGSYYLHLTLSFDTWFFENYSLGVPLFS